ncbi:MAG: type II secretion system protein [Candidatus Margulisiibacteriota bacterium]
MMNKKGFTLIELIMVMVITSIIGTFFLGRITMYLARGFIFNVNRENTRANADLVYTTMTRDIRNVKDDASIITANNILLTFNTTDDEIISFSVSGNVLYKSVDGMPYTLAENVENVNFSFHDKNETLIPIPITGLSTTTDIRLIRALVVLKGKEANLTINFQVSPRNIWTVNN